MKIILTSVALFLGATLMGQTIMNIHQSDGSTLMLPLNTIDSITYTVTNPGNLATLTTTPISGITSTDAQSGGNITNDGGSLVTQKGVVWGLAPNPTTANSSSIDGAGIGSYSSTLNNLTVNTTYYVRAYAINSAGTAYGNELSFTTSSGIDVTPGAGVTDIEGTSYETLVFGNGQEWLAENLMTATYANGDPIPNVADSATWYDLTTGAWVNYENNSTYGAIYGKLYNGYAVQDSRNVCPAGWHVPSLNEWNTFVSYLGGAYNAASSMKETGTQHWSGPNSDATNSSQFTALPGGQRNGAVTDFSGLQDRALWWTSSGSGSFYDYMLLMENGSGQWFVQDLNYYSRMGYSVRCIKD